MATNNLKVSGYVPETVYNQLVQFKQTHQLKSISQAVTLILESYLGLDESGAPTASEATNARLLNLESNYQTLIEQVEQLRQTLELMTDSLPVTFCRLLTEQEELQSILNTLKPGEPNEHPG